MNNIGLQNLICSPGHYHYFLTDFRVRRELMRAEDYIMAHGFPAYVMREYPPRGEKRIIINQIGDRFYVVDGNKHLTAMLLVYPNLCVEDLACVYHGVFRFWKCGIEDEIRQSIPYEVYIPAHINTSAIRNTKIGYDYFKAVPLQTKIIPADIPFDSPQFTERDKGRSLAEMVKAFRRFRYIQNMDKI